MKTSKPSTNSGVNSGIHLSLATDRGFKAQLAEAEERTRRLALIEKADHTCQKCGTVAWSAKLMREMQTRPKEAVAGKPSTGDWVVCGKCAEAHDAKKRKRAG